MYFKIADDRDFSPTLSFLYFKMSQEKIIRIMSYKTIILYGPTPWDKIPGKELESHDYR